MRSLPLQLLTFRNLSIVGEKLFGVHGFSMFSMRSRLSSTYKKLQHESSLVRYFALIQLLLSVANMVILHLAILINGRDQPLSTLSHCLHLSHSVCNILHSTTRLHQHKLGTALGGLRISASRYPSKQRPKASEVRDVKSLAQLQEAAARGAAGWLDTADPQTLQKKDLVHRAALVTGPVCGKNTAVKN